jgi:hypothetical protein
MSDGSTETPQDEAQQFDEVEVNLIFLAGTLTLMCELCGEQFEAAITARDPGNVDADTEHEIDCPHCTKTTGKRTFGMVAVVDSLGFGEAPPDAQGSS